MRINHLTTHHYRIPLRSAMTDAMHGEMTHFEVIMVGVETDTGARGLGYTYTIGHGGAAIRSLINESLGPLVLNEDPRRIEKLWERMWWSLHYVGRGGLVSFAISAVDIALWDLIGSQEGIPLWRLLGGHSNLVRPYAGGIDLHLTTDELVEQTHRNLGKGFRAIKIKVGQPNIRQDFERVEAVRAVLGPDIPLMVDANMRWDVETAIRSARGFQPFNVFWLEEPTIPDDIQGHARIAKEGGLPVASGENLHSIYEFRNLIEDGLVTYPEPDVSNCGGITGWMRVARLAYAHNLPVTTHGVYELHLHLLAAVPNASFLEVHGFGLERFIKHPPEILDGVMLAPEAPGHGVQFHWDLLEEYEINPSPIRSANLSAASKRALSFSRGAEWFCEFREHDLGGDFAYEAGVIRRDPSAVLKIGDTYYVWYTKGEGETVGFNSGDPSKKVFPWDLTEVWYATSQDGWAWKEQGRAVGRGPQGSFDDRAVFTPEILAHGGKYYLVYQVVQFPYLNRVKEHVGMAVAGSPDGPWVKLPHRILSPAENGIWLGEEDNRFK